MSGAAGAACAAARSRASWTAARVRVSHGMHIGAGGRAAAVHRVHTLHTTVSRGRCRAALRATDVARTVCLSRLRFGRQRRRARCACRACRLDVHTRLIRLRRLHCSSPRHVTRDVLQRQTTQANPGCSVAPCGASCMPLITRCRTGAISPRVQVVQQPRRRGEALGHAAARASAPAPAPVRTALRGGAFPWLLRGARCSAAAASGQRNTHALPRTQGCSGVGACTNNTCACPAGRTGIDCAVGGPPAAGPPCAATLWVRAAAAGSASAPVH